MIRLLFAWALVPAMMACTSYRGSARPVAPSELATEPGWILIRDVPYVAQVGESECGAASVAMVVSYWTGAAPASVVAAFQPVPASGLSAARLRDYARARGLASFVIAGTFKDLERELAAGRPVLVGLSKPMARKKVLDHYEVVVGLHRARRLVITLDPSEGWQQNTMEGFAREWQLAKFVTVVVSARAQPRSPPL
jgi:ABC-type bacteriocin/lantibiotic exporter with double-glycine peptidase domain